jgi:hypothetical protein
MNFISLPLCFIKIKDYLIMVEGKLLKELISESLITKHKEYIINYRVDYDLRI